MDTPRSSPRTNRTRRVPHDAGCVQHPLAAGLAESETLQLALAARARAAPPGAAVFDAASGGLAAAAPRDLLAVPPEAAEDKELLVLTRGELLLLGADARGAGARVPLARVAAPAALGAAASTPLVRGAVAASADVEILALRVRRPAAPHPHPVSRRAIPQRPSSGK